MSKRELETLYGLLEVIDAVHRHGLVTDEEAMSMRTRAKRRAGYLVGGPMTPGDFFDDDVKTCTAPKVDVLALQEGDILVIHSPSPVAANQLERMQEQIPAQLEEALGWRPRVLVVDQGMTLSVLRPQADEAGSGQPPTMLGRPIEIDNQLSNGEVIMVTQQGESRASWPRHPGAVVEQFANSNVQSWMMSQRTLRALQRQLAETSLFP